MSDKKTNITIEELKELVSKKLQHHGISNNESLIVAEVLVHADERGVHSHGVMRMNHYIEKIKKGGINPAPSIVYDSQSPSAGVVEGDAGFGHVVAEYSTQKAIKNALNCGVGLVTARNSSHCGALSFYTEMIADSNLIGIVMSQTDKAVVPFGGKEPFFGTNPMAIGAPAYKEKPFIFDMATSAAALGKVLKAREENKSIPLEWGVDINGEKVNDPFKLKNLLPAGGPKGYGLAAMVDILSGILAGVAFGPHINSMYENLEQKRNLGHFFLAVNPAYFTDLNTFLSQMDQMIRELREAPSGGNAERVYVPGEIEQIKAEQSKKEGVFIDQNTINFLKQ